MSERTFDIEYTEPFLEKKYTIFEKKGLENSSLDNRI